MKNIDLLGGLCQQTAILASWIDIRIVDPGNLKCTIVFKPAVDMQI